MKATQPPDTSVPSAFDGLRLPYKGAPDTVKCIEVDVRANRVYAGCYSGGVFVWELKTHRPVAVLRHPQWVNVIKCYPPLDNSVTQDSKLALLRLRQRDERLMGKEAAAKKHAGMQRFFERLAQESSVLNSRTELLLTGSEDGVLSAWCPVTFRIREQYKPGHGPLTTMQFGSGPQAMMLANETGSIPPLCYVAAMEWICVMRVFPTFQLIQQFKHRTFITALECLPSTRLPTLLVGQEDGAIVCWSLDSWRHSGTLVYPSREEDIENDGRRAALVMPRLDVANCKVEDTFAYNKRRCENPRHNGLSDNRPPQELEDLYRVTISTTVDPYLKEQLRQPGHVSRVADLPDSVTLPYLHYDRRRTTCLASGQITSVVSHRFFSGHATGEVLLWEASLTGYHFFLLKKVPVYTGLRRWVWHMNTLEFPISAILPSTTDPASRKQKVKTKGGGRGSGGEASSKEDLLLPSPCTMQEKRAFFLVLMVISDTGNVQLLTFRRRVVRQAGPGGLSTASFYWFGSHIEPPRQKDIEGRKEDEDDATGSTSFLSAPAATSQTVASFDCPSATTTTLELTASAAIPLSEHNRSPRQQPARHLDNSGSDPLTAPHHYVMMGTFEGRIERHDVTAVVNRLMRLTLED